jgi:cardiolipin synthase (CMP-forming)
MNLPNLLSLTRILLIPFFIILIMNQRFGWALFLFAIAGFTDGIDGLIARLTHQRTELGAYLDPIADKILISSSFVTLAIIQIVPSWLAVLVIARDVLIILGILMMILTNHRYTMQPTVLSKITTFFQISTILLALMARCDLTPPLLSKVAVYGAALFTVLSGSHYISVGTRILNPKKN